VKYYKKKWLGLHGDGFHWEVLEDIKPKDNDKLPIYTPEMLAYHTINIINLGCGTHPDSKQHTPGNYDSNILIYISSKLQLVCLHCFDESNQSNKNLLQHYWEILKEQHQV